MDESSLPRDETDATSSDELPEGRLPSWSTKSHKHLICALRSLTRTQHPTACGGYLLPSAVTSGPRFISWCCVAIPYGSYATRALKSPVRN